MSVDTDSEDMRQKLYRLARKDPLCHPGVSSIVLHNYEYPPPEHLRNMYGKIYRAIYSEEYDNPQPQRLGFFLPREHGKSEAATVVTPSWYALKEPNSRTLIISETATQARKKLQQCRNVILRHKHHLNREIEVKKQTEITLKRSVNHAEPTIEAAGMGKSITGGHYDLIIFDDILSWDNQRTETQREKARNRFKDYLNLGSEGETVYVVIGTRKHPKDLYGGLIENPIWDTTVRKAISDWSVIENGEYGVKTLRRVEIDESHNPNGDESTPPRTEKKFTNYEADEIHKIDADEETIVDVLPYRDVPVLWPERWSLDDLIEDMLSTMIDDQQSPLVWRRENQNDPTVMEGQILNIDWLDYVDELPKDRDYYSWYAGLDIAVVEDAEEAAMKDSDYWALAILAHDSMNDETYLHDVQRKRGMSLNEGIDWVDRLLTPYNISGVLVESNQAQRWFVQTAKDKGLRVKKTSSSDSKQERIVSLSSQFESGKIKVLKDESEGAKWESFEAEWAAFPNGDHDDRLDAVEIAYRNTEGQEIKSSKHSTGIFR